MTGMSDSYLTELQRSHPSADEQLQAYKQESLELYDQLGAQAAQSCFYDGFKDVMERTARHEMLKHVDIHAFFQQAVKADRVGFELIINEIIDCTKS